jgi:hypothetical protein
MTRAPFAQLITANNAAIDELLAGVVIFNGVSLAAIVDYREESRDIGGIGAVQQDMTVLLRRSLIAHRPDAKNDLITLPKIPGKSWQPIGVGLDESGDYWLFGLREAR